MVLESVTLAYLEYLHWCARMSQDPLPYEQWIEEAIQFLEAPHLTQIVFPIKKSSVPPITEPLPFDKLEGDE